MIFTQFLCAIGLHRWFQDTLDHQVCLRCVKWRKHKGPRDLL